MDVASRTGPPPLHLLSFGVWLSNPATWQNIGSRALAWQQGRRSVSLGVLPRSASLGSMLYLTRKEQGYEKE